MCLLKGFKPAGCEALGPTCGLRVDGMGGFFRSGLKVRDYGSSVLGFMV